MIGDGESRRDSSKFPCHTRPPSHSGTVGHRSDASQSKVGALWDTRPSFPRTAFGPQPETPRVTGTGRGRWDGEPRGGRVSLGLSDTIAGLRKTPRPRDSPPSVVGRHTGHRYPGRLPKTSYSVPCRDPETKIPAVVGKTRLVGLIQG